MNDYSFIFECKYEKYFAILQKIVNEYSFIFKSLTKAMLTPLTGLYEMIQKRPLAISTKKIWGWC